MPEIAVVIPVFDGGDDLHRCLSSLSRARPQPAAVVVVSDGGTEDLTFVESEFGARLIHRSERGGPARARNEGARNCTSDILLFLDADVLVMPDVISQVAEIFRDPSVSAAIGSYDDEPADPNFLSQYRNLLHHYVHQTGKEEASTFWGACGAIRRADFEEAGGFDGERYSEPSIEDIELGYRLRNAGRRIVLSKNLQVRHQKRWRFLNMVKTDFARRALPWSDLILRTDNLVNDLNTNTANRLGSALTLVLVVSVTMLPLSLAFGAVAIVAAALLMAVNWSFYWFLRRRRGIAFALKAVPMHWLLLLLSGVAFAASLTRFQFDRLRGAT